MPVPAYAPTTYVPVPGPPGPPGPPGAAGDGSLGVVSVKAYGAVADGATSDTAHVQSAIAAANASAGVISTLYFPAGVYYITRQTTDLICGIDLNGASKLNLRGAGRNNTILRMEPTFASNCYGILRLRACSDIAISDMTIDGSWSGQDGVEEIHGIMLNAVGARLGTLSSDPDGSTPTVTLTVAANGSNFSVGLYYSFWHASGGNPIGEPFAGPYLCTAKSAVSGTVTFSTNVDASVGAGDMLCQSRQNVDRVWIDNVSFRNTRGDGLRMQGEAVNKVQNVFVSNTDYINCKRSAVSFQRNIRHITIDKFYAENVTDSILDMEPSTSGNALAPQYVTLMNGHCKRVSGTVQRMITIVGFSLAQPCRYINLSNITVEEGTFQIFKCQDVHAINLNVTGDSANLGTVQCLEVKLCQDVYVGHSVFTRPVGATASQVVGVLTDSSYPIGVVLDEVVVHQATAADAVLFQTAQRCTMRGGHVYFEYNSTNLQTGVLCQSNTSDTMDDVNIDGVEFHGDAGGGTLKYGVRWLSNPGAIAKTRTMNCRGTGLWTGAYYTGTGSGFTVQPRFNDNNWTCSNAPYLLDGTTTGLKCLTIYGNRGSRHIFQGAGSPEGVVTGSVGDQFWRTDGSVGTLVYEKQSGSATNTGWVGLTSAGLADGDKGDVTVSSSGAAWAIASGVVTNTKLANVATATLKGRTTAGTGSPEDLTVTQATALLNVATSSLKGLAPASGGGTSNFLRADLSWAAPTGTAGPAGVDGTLYQRVSVPSYFYPTYSNPLSTDDWKRIANKYPASAYVVINPSSGPGGSSNPDYVTEVGIMQAAGIKVLGYVHCSGNTRTIGTVEGEIDNYVSWYNPDGILVDEADNSTDATKLTYATNLYNYIKAHVGGDALVVWNPGTSTVEQYAAIADGLMVFEGDPASYRTRSVGAGTSWELNYSPKLFWHVIYNCGLADVSEMLALSRLRNAGHIYITPDVLSNPYDTLSAYWNRLVAKVAGGATLEPVGSIYQSSAAAATVLAAATFAKATCPTLLAETSPGPGYAFVMPSNNRLAFDGPSSINFQVACSVTVTKATGGATTGELRIMKNGSTTVATSASTTLPNDSSQVIMNCDGAVALTAGDYVEAWLMSTNGDDLTCIRLVLSAELA